MYELQSVMLEIIPGRRRWWQAFWRSRHGVCPFAVCIVCVLVVGSFLDVLDTYNSSTVEVLKVCMHLAHRSSDIVLSEFERSRQHLTLVFKVIDLFWEVKYE